MPRINLLPAKRILREQGLKAELRAVSLVLAGELLCLFAHAQVQQSLLSSKRARLDEARSNADSFAAQVQQIGEFKAALKLLGAKLATIDALIERKRGPTRLLATFAEALVQHPRVWLKELDEHDNVARIGGQAMSQGDISAFQMALQAHADVFASVTLDWVRAADTRSSRVLDWSMTLGRRLPP